MGDHRFSFKAEFKMHGVEEEINLGWHNWSGGRDGIDSRITEWLENAVHKAFARFDADYDAYLAEQSKDRIEKEEREQLARLQKKYG